MIYFSATDNSQECPETRDESGEEDIEDMRRDEDEDDSVLGFSDLCKYIEKCIARKYKVDKSEALKVSF